MKKSTLTLALVAASSTLFAKEKKPNIIFILADDLGYGDVAYLNKESKISTPNIDKLALHGQIYTDAHTASSVSTPSRYSVITGRYCWRSPLKKGVLTGYSLPLIEKNRPTVASMLKQQGYNTACIGKWHLGMSWQSTDGKKVDVLGKNAALDKPIADTPADRGFDYFYGISASLDFSPFLMIENHNVIDKADIFYTSEHEKINPYKARRYGYAVKGRKPQHFLPKLVSKVEEKIGEYSKEKEPFFIYFALTAPHEPVAPNKEFIGKSGAGAYGDFVVEVDDVVRRVMKSLKDNGIDDNTLVVFTSDNGPETIAYTRGTQFKHYSSGELKGIKRDLWEGGHRVPFIVHWPKEVKGATKVETPICLVDFYATAADIVGHKTEHKEAEDSYSLLNLMRGKKSFDRPYTIHHSSKGNFAIRKGDWVLIDNAWGDDNATSKSKKYFLERGYKEYSRQSGELFNLNEDLRQFKNVYSQYPDKVAELKKLLEECKAQ